MKLWVDDVRRAPEGYVHAYSVDVAKSVILFNEELARKLYSDINRFTLKGDFEMALKMESFLKQAIIELIDVDHDAGDFTRFGGDYIKLLDWLEETGRNYPIHIHSMNPVGVENMRRIIRKNGWIEV